jgi:hypothetical protein
LTCDKIKVNVIIDGEKRIIEESGQTETLNVVRFDFNGGVLKRICIPRDENYAEGIIELPEPVNKHTIFEYKVFRDNFVWKAFMYPAGYAPDIEYQLQVGIF